MAKHYLNVCVFLSDKCFLMGFSTIAVGLILGIYSDLTDNQLIITHSLTYLKYLHSAWFLDG